MGKCVYLYSVLRDCPKDFPLPGSAAFPAEPGDGKPFKKEEACRRKQFLLHAFVYLCGCATSNPRKPAGGSFRPHCPRFSTCCGEKYCAMGCATCNPRKQAEEGFHPHCPRFSICHGGKYCAMGCTTCNPRKRAGEVSALTARVSPLVMERNSV